jgi:hypothetical protein
VCVRLFQGFESYELFHGPSSVPVDRSTGLIRLMNLIQDFHCRGDILSVGGDALMAFQHWIRCEILFAGRTDY